MSDPSHRSFICSRLLKKAAKGVKRMAGITKLFKRNCGSARPHSVKSSVPATVVAATSSVSPDCNFVTRHRYRLGRRLVTRMDIRARMCVWRRLFGLCRGLPKLNMESEPIFTVRP